MQSMAALANPDQLNINAPNREGVSRNKMDSFNVESQGMIINNSQNTTDTKLGGRIKGNPALARGNEASVIINEVSGKNPSRLEGMIEVAGRRADVIIANPMGITCSGCGFINAQRGVFTTGQVMMENGRLKGFDVEKGEVSFQGEGLLGRGARYTDILARSVRINADIKSNQIRLVTGRNTIENRDSEQMVVNAKSGSDSNIPRFALDVTALGGMYANKISLVGTEKGVGVRNAGELSAGAGGVSLRSDGRIHNMTTINGQAFVTLTSQGEIDNKGKIQSAEGYVTATSSNWVNTGSVTGKTQVSITSKGVVDNPSGVIQGENVMLNAAKDITNGGTLAAKGGTMTLSAQGRIDNTRSLTSKKHMSLTGAKVENQKLISSEDSLSITSKGSVKNKGMIQSGGHLSLASDGFQNKGSAKSQAAMSINTKGVLINTGSLISQRSIKTTFAKGSNNAGVINAHEDIVLLSPQKVSNKGAVKGGGRINGESKGRFDNINGRIHAKGDLTLNTGGGVLTNSCSANTKGCGIYSDRNISIVAGKVNVKGQPKKMIAGKRIRIR